MPPSTRQRLSHPLAAAITVFLLTAMTSGSLVWRLEQDRLQRQRMLASGYANDRAQALQVGIERALSANYALAALVQESNGTIPNFDTVAGRMLPFYPGVSELALAADGVLREVYPLPGNEKAVGLNVLEYPPQQTEAAISRDTGKLTLAGPLNLVQGGQGLVGRLPIFVDDANGKPAFWGFAEVVMRLPGALEPGRLSQLVARGYRYQLWRTQPHTGARQIIDAASPIALIDPVEQTLQVPNGTWTLSVAPVIGWGNSLGLAINASLGLLFSLLPAYLVKLLIELRANKKGLEGQITEHVAEIFASKNQLEATINAIPDLVWLKDENGVYLNCNPQMERFFGATKADILGKTDYHFVDQQLADFFRDNDRKAMAVDKPRTNEEWLTFAADNYHGLFETVKTPMRDAEGNFVGVLGIARDITEHVRREDELRESQTQLNIALESTQIGIWNWDLTRDLWYASPTYFTMLGYTPETGPADRSTGLSRVHPDDQQDVVDRIATVLQGSETLHHYEVRMLHADGDYRWVSVRGKVVETDTNGKATRMLGVRIDINELKQAEERVHWLAHFDLLTGLPNRTMLHARINHAIGMAQNSREPLALLFLDLDHFKNVNDTLGHRIGDELLLAAAKRMQTVVREEDMVSRQGGDEFILVLPGADAGQAAHIAEKLLEKISQRYQIEQYELVVTPSIGISMYPQDGEDFDALFKCADIAMYSAKREGRNNYQFFTAELQARSARTLQLENALRRALERGELSLNYQPQIALEDRRVIGAEALLRWRHPELGAVAPTEFIPIAEDSGQILQIGEWVLRSAVTQMKNWIDRGLPPMIIAVNLSAVQFRHADLPELIKQILEEAQLPAEYLELELTERVAMHNPLDAIATMNKLHECGVRMSIDDFGTGYSSLSYLKRFQVYKLKIDRSFVSNVTDDAEDKAIVGAIISLANSLGMQTIAEGVETEAQLALLQKQGCNEVQGYYFSKPLPAEEFEIFVRGKGWI